MGMFDLIADPEELSRVLMKRWGRESPVQVHPGVFDHEPTGSRLLVILDPPPTSYGAIILTEQTQKLEKLGAGTVVSVGPQVGIGTPYPGGPTLDADGPAGLLYKHVVFGEYSGKGLRLDYIADREFESNVLILADRDIWTVLKDRL